MNTKRYIILFLYVLVICAFTGSTVVADTVIPYELNNGWTYEADYTETLELAENPDGGIIVNINIDFEIGGGDDGGLVASRHDLPGYSLEDHGFIQLEYSSLSFEITGVPEGPDLCLEIEFYDEDEVHYQMGIDVWQYDGDFFWGTWFGSEPDSSYYETPVPDGLSVAEGALGLYSDGALVLPYFIDASGSVLYPFDPWDVSEITGTHEYSVDNDFEGVTTVGGTIIASVNLEQVVYGPGTPPEPPVLDDDLDIERVYMSYSKDYLDGTAVTNPWFFMARIDFADMGSLVSIEMTLPDGVTTYTLVNENGTWEYRSWPTVYPTLTAVRTDYPEGIYTFDFRDGSGLLIKSIQLDFSGLTEPDGPVDFTYPSYNGQTDISTSPTFTWTVDSGAGDALVVSLDDYSEVTVPIVLPMDTLSWQPGPLDPEHDYRLYVDILRFKDWTDGSGFPTETVGDDTFEYVFDIGYHNDIAFTTAALSADPIEEIEEILDFVDESVEDETLTGEGPGNSGNNRLNALINMLEEVQSLIEAGLYEEACDQLWSAYRKCDGENRPPDFVIGEAAEDLADMILLMMDELGC